MPDRGADGAPLRAAVEAACALGLDLAVVSGGDVQSIDGQLGARPRGPGELHLLPNHGSEVFRASVEGVELLARQTASAAQEAALDRAAELAVAGYGALGLHTRIVSRGLNRRKIDLIRTAESADRPAGRVAELFAAVEVRLREHSLDGLPAAVELAAAAAAEVGLPDARVTSDAEHIEIGLADTSDSARWFFTHLWRRGVDPEQVLIIGDELGPLGGLPGSDAELLIDAAARSHRGLGRGGAGRRPVRSDRARGRTGRVRPAARPPARAAPPRCPADRLIRCPLDARDR